MKRLFPAILILMSTLAGCGRLLPASDESQGGRTSSQTESTSQGGNSSQGGGTSTSEGPVNPKRAMTIQDGTILHAWNWSMNNIKNELANIKNAGYNTVQLSPMQPQKDYYGGSWQSQWWKLYQPYGFKVASNNGENILGTKAELTSLCTEAKKQGINIIVDVVTNHLAGGSKTSMNGQINNYEPTIYSNNLIHTLGQWADDNNLQSIVQGNIGDYPDLKTEDTRVQERVISMLKEYIDCGISGFRFDAAKHIETPDDGQYASNYWPNVTNAARTYAASKGIDDLYIYGEILYKCGAGRNFSSYTKYMSVIDNTQGTSVRNAVNAKNLNFSTSYNAGNADHLVLWAESHDTYANDDHETTNISNDVINRTYMIQASRKDATSLFFARPGNASMGAIGTSDYKNKEIAAINKFHNMYYAEDEAISNDGTVFVNVRGNNQKGAALINVDSSTSKTVTVNLPNGEYTDLASGNKFQVNNNKVNATFTNGACILVPKDKGEGGDVIDKPEVTITPSSLAFTSYTDVTITTNASLESFYQINDGPQMNFTRQTTIKRCGEYEANGPITIKVTAKNEGATTIKSLTLAKTNLANKNIVVINVPNDCALLVWEWETGKEGKWLDMEKDKTTYAVDLSQKNYLIAKFASGTKASNAVWKNVKSQTSDLTYSSRVIYDYSELGL